MNVQTFHGETMLFNLKITETTGKKMMEIMYCNEINEYVEEKKRILI